MVPTNQATLALDVNLEQWMSLQSFTWFWVLRTVWTLGKEPGSVCLAGSINWSRQGKAFVICKDICFFLVMLSSLSPNEDDLKNACSLWAELKEVNLSSCRHAKSLQSCPTLCDPMDCSPPGSSVHGSLQARILVWVAMPSSRGSSQPRDQTHASCVSCTAGGFFTPEHKCILFILNFWADIWFLVDTLESNYWLLHLKFNDSREIKWKRVRQIDNRIDQCQACFFPLLSSLLFRTLLCNFTITQKGNRNYLPLQIQRQEIRG